MKNKPQVIFLVGPTASGKSDTVLELALSLNAEIISADSMQVYKYADILSAKPSAHERAKVTYHLIDILEPDQEYNAALFCEKSAQAIKEVIAKRKMPLVCGGSGMYVRSLVNGMFEDKGKNIKLREELNDLACKKGNEFVYAKLKKIDPLAAEKIHPNNIRRVIRAIEAFEMNKEKFSSLKMKIKPLSDSYKVKMFGIERDRKDLYQRIDERVDRMFAQGIVEEVKRLNDFNLSSTISQAIGIKQINQYLKGSIGLTDAVELVKRDTRRFAKRQLTWFRQEKDVCWIKVEKDDTPQETAEEISRTLLSENK